MMFFTQFGILRGWSNTALPPQSDRLSVAGDLASDSLDAEACCYEGANLRSLAD
jgi:hypothetical protein